MMLYKLCFIDFIIVFYIDFMNWEGDKRPTKCLIRGEVGEKGGKRTYKGGTAFELTDLVCAFPFSPWPWFIA